MTTTPQDVLDSLTNIRGLRDSEITLLLDAAARGEAEGIEWVMERIADLAAAAGLLRAIATDGLDAGGWATMRDLATREGVTYDAIRQRIERGGVEYVEGPAQGRGPSVQTYARSRERA